MRRLRTDPLGIVVVPVVDDLHQDREIRRGEPIDEEVAGAALEPAVQGKLDLIDDVREIELREVGPDPAGIVQDGAGRPVRSDDASWVIASQVLG